MTSHLAAWRIRHWGWMSGLLLTASCHWVFGQYELEDAAASDAGEDGVTSVSPRETRGESAAGGRDALSPTSSADRAEGGAGGSMAISSGGQGALHSGAAGASNAAGGIGPTGGTSPTSPTSAADRAEGGAGGSMTISSGGQGALHSGAAGASNATGGIGPTGGTSASSGGSDTSTGGAGGASGSEDPACAGELYGGICWYLGARGDSCTETCANHGGTAAEAASYVGTDDQGGSLAECAAVLQLLGVANANSTTGFTSNDGVGCVVYFGVLGVGLPVWITNTPFNPDDSPGSGQSRLACGCNE